MKNDLGMLALAVLVFFMMYCVGEAIIETLKAIAHAFS